MHKPGFDGDELVTLLAFALFIADMYIIIFKVMQESPKYVNKLVSIVTANDHTVEKLCD